MEENVALDSSKQKQFVKSIKGIKKLIKKNDTKGVSEKISKTKGEDGKVKKKKRAPRGLVYLGHIPHGFYEHAMTQYFKQFGVVTNARVIRSKRTGNSKGFAFVEFKEPAVAEIVAETMNNYLMGKRLIKAAYIPPEKQKRHAKRKFWSQAFNPTNEARMKMKKAYNSNKDDKGDLQKARKLISNINKTKKKLSALGINYDFFSPVDVPESLVNLISAAEIKEEKKVKEGKKVKENVNSTKGKKAKEITPKVEESKTQVENKKGKKNVVTENVEKAQEKKQVVKKEKKPIVENKSAKKPVVVNEKQQSQKEKKLKDAGVKSVENFIKIQQDSGDDSDSSYEFNSDEYEKMLSDEDGSDVSGSEEESGSDKEDDTEEDSDGSIPPQLVPAKMPKAVQKTKVQKNISKDEKKPIKIHTTEKKVPQIKRKASQKTIVAPKKSKFENKNTQKLAKKQFKKKK